MRQLNGMFLIFDGPSGTGKDTLIRLIKTQLPCSVLSEEELDPRRGEILAARAAAKQRRGSGDLEMAQVLIAHRAEIYKQHLYPVLQDGRIVIANRGEPATLVYQTARKELSMQQVWQMHRQARIIVPNLVVILTCSVEIALARDENDRLTSVIRREAEGGRRLSGQVSHEPGADLAEVLRRKEAIHAGYEQVEVFLKRKGVDVLRLDTEKLTPEMEASRVLEALQK